MGVEHGGSLSGVTVRGWLEWEGVSEKDWVSSMDPPLPMFGLPAGQGLETERVAAIGVAVSRKQNFPLCEVLGCCNASSLSAAITKVKHKGPYSASGDANLSVIGSSQYLVRARDEILHKNEHKNTDA